MGGQITGVDRGSVGARAGLQPGDVLLSINGFPLRDVIDAQFHGADESLALRVRRGQREFSVSVERGYDEPLGLQFARPTFDTDVRRCDNRCEFCFVAQMPPGLRRSLYVKDDDYRHSFLFGNYVTLTNLAEADWERIGEQHLSPLYVSVHATDPELRRRFLRNPDAPDVSAQLRRLAEMGIEVHTQLVVVPGLNDGPHLDRSIGDLAELYPAVRSVSVVPVGLTRHHRGGCRLHTLEEARTLFNQVSGWQARLRPRLGVRFAYLSDEWYLRLGEEVPPADAYDRLDLTENGVGLVRGFLDGGAQVSDLGPGAVAHLRSATLVTGTLFAPVLEQATAHLGDVEVAPVVNRFFGESVTVAGLLTARDVVEQLAGRPLGDVVVLPAAMFGGPEGQSLDEMGPEQVGAALGREVATAHTLADLAGARDGRPEGR
jgi:putative radical SAM enzyme (TIGR03279 family)